MPDNFHYSLASGFLTGKYRSEGDLSKSLRGGGVKKYLNERGFNILKALDAVATEMDTTPTAVAVAWVIAQPGITAPIASATDISQLQQITSAVQLTLNIDQVTLLNDASKY
ncbi:MAG: aldo/keto reductase [Sphingobacteriaceae bacterium]|nr:MAG: aldo/keto reductase [Sphingobacteriaceae bacterium]